VAEITPPRPLAESDDRSGFDCGRDSINQWFRTRAWSNQVLNLSRTNVICDASDGVPVGFVTLSAAQIERGFLAGRDRRNKPDPLPATLLGQLAIDRAHQGRGHAASLLRFALITAVSASQIIASFAVITHPLDDGLRSFYRRWGFEDMPFDPHRAMIVRIAELELAGIKP
jgi:hypothetical protein